MRNEWEWQRERKDWERKRGKEDKISSLFLFLRSKQQAGSNLNSHRPSVRFLFSRRRSPFCSVVLMWRWTARTCGDFFLSRWETILRTCYLRTPNRTCEYEPGPRFSRISVISIAACCSPLFSPVVLSIRSPVFVVRFWRPRGRPRPPTPKSTPDPFSWSHFPWDARKFVEENG